jgi:hypothetical protein
VDGEVRELIRRRGPGPFTDPTPVRVLVRDVVADYRDVLDRVAGFGPLQPYPDDPEIEEFRSIRDLRKRGLRPSGVLAVPPRGGLTICRQAELIALWIGENEPGLVEFLVGGCGQSSCSQPFETANLGVEVGNQQV